MGGRASKATSYDDRGNPDHSVNPVRRMTDSEESYSWNCVEHSIIELQKLRSNYLLLKEENRALRQELEYYRRSARNAPYPSSLDQHQHHHYDYSASMVPRPLPVRTFTYRVDEAGSLANCVSDFMRLVEQQLKDRLPDASVSLRSEPTSGSVNLLFVRVTGRLDTDDVRSKLHSMAVGCDRIIVVIVHMENDTTRFVRETHAHESLGGEAALIVDAAAFPQNVELSATSVSTVLAVQQITDFFLTATGTAQVRG
jgi:hypothetical protein